MRIGKFALGATLGAAALVITSPALAHAHLIKSDPAANATVAAPKTISLTFNETLVPSFSKAEIIMDGMKMTVPVKTTVSNDGKTLVATPQGKMMAGGYHVKWTAASADGHRMTGEVGFKVH